MKIKPTSEKAKSALKVSSRSHLGEHVPQLRFPGFNGEWNCLKLNDFAERVTRKNGSTSDIPLTISAQHGLIDQRTFFSKAVASADMSGYYLLKNGEFAYNRSSSGEFPFGSIKRLDQYKAGAVSTLYICFGLRDQSPVSDFIKWYFDSSKWHREAGLICAEGARNHGLLNVPTVGFFNTVHHIPVNKDEQEKIAVFLSLVDRRITAQRRLVELLKKHKRGVIEQIFGRRLDMGENPEKWNVVELRDLFSKVARRNRGGKVKNVITNSAEFGLIPQRNFFDKSIAVDGNTDGYYVIRTGDFVYNPRKSTTAPFGPFNRYTGTEDGIISPLYTCLVPKGKANPEYLAWYFRSTAWHRYVYDNGSQGARHDRVNMTDDLLFGIPVLLPPIAVQERIANGLNAINARWSSANIVLAHLEKMKRGLLQQLFA